MAALETRLLVFSLRRTGGRLHLVVPTLGRIPIGRAPLTGYWERGDLVLRIPGRPRLVFTPSQSGFLSACQQESDRTVILVNHHGRFRTEVIVSPLAQHGSCAALRFDGEQDEPPAVSHSKAANAAG